MAPEAAKKDRAVRSAIRSEEARKFRAGDRVSIDGKLSKVIDYSVRQISGPGEDLEYSDGPVLSLQLPADSVGAKNNYAYNVLPGEVTPLKDDPKKLAALEKEWNAL